MIVVGGTYDEHCFEPNWIEKFGSGLRACRIINALEPTLEIQFHTFGDTETEVFLKQVSLSWESIKCSITPIAKTISFYYDHPLITPRIFPRLDTIDRSNNIIKCSGDNILYFGLIEGDAQIEGKKVVYDPQSPSNPIPFSKTGSRAESLAIIINYVEAIKLSGSKDLSDIRNFFFEQEMADILVLKMGPKGAVVITGLNDEGTVIPVYKTASVWPIGTGDIFAAVFSYYWFKGKNPVESASQASWATAVYSCTQKFEISQFESVDTIHPLRIDSFPVGQIYLAGPFFTFSERWLIDQIRRSLLDMRLKVFSPWHDIGHGIASEVVELDLKGLDESKMIFAILDGLDSGTLFEIGYAVSKGIPVVAYVENESSESVKMLEGTNCILEKDLTTAIYKSLWLLAENE